MIEISYGHKIENNILYKKKISIGRGLPTYGQICLITIVEEELDLKDGVILWANMIWSFWEKSKIKRR